MYNYGILKSEGASQESNPIYNNLITIKPKSYNDIKLYGEGKIIQISFLTNNDYLLLGVSIDNKKLSLINNGFCIEHVADSRGIGYIQRERVQIHSDSNLTDNNYKRITCLIPFKFKKNITIKLINERAANIQVYGLHIYYLVKENE